VRGKVGVEFADLGVQGPKNIALPVRAHAVVRKDPTRRQSCSARSSTGRLPLDFLSLCCLSSISAVIASKTISSTA
jgi:hypothetical protein